MRGGVPAKCDEPVQRKMVPMTSGLLMLKGTQGMGRGEIGVHRSSKKPGFSQTTGIRSTETRFTLIGSTTTIKQLFRKRSPFLET